MRSLLVFSLLLFTVVACGPTAQDIRKMNDAAEEPDPNRKPIWAEVSVFSVHDGDCLTGVVLSGEIESARIVPCYDYWQYKVLSSLTLIDSPVFMDLEYIYMEALNRCPREFTDIIRPTEESWNEGDRTVKCLVAR